MRQCVGKVERMSNEDSIETVRTLGIAVTSAAVRPLGLASARDEEHDGNHNGRHDGAEAR